MLNARILAATLLMACTALLTSCGARLSIADRAARAFSSQAQAPGEPVVLPDFNPSLADGKAVYSKLRCAECHGDKGEGANFAAPRILSDPTKEQADRTPIFQYKILCYGVPGWDHPVLRGRLSNREVWDLVFYVRSFTSPPLTAAERDRLGTVYGANCADCHGEKGYGDGPLSHNLAPLPANFHQFDRFFDRQDSMLYNHIADGLYPAAMPGFFGRRDRMNGVVFDQRFIKQMARYVRHFETDYEPTDISRDLEGAGSGKQEDPHG
jgi:mono/diheme cytochrome c family protein